MRPFDSRRRTGAAAALLVLLALAGPACSRRPGRRVLLVGMDGATFRVADDLLAAGRLPHLKSLIDRGVRARLRSDPPMLSPAIWTTIATGKTRAKHGIRDFVQTVVDGKGYLVNSNFRRTAALWNMLTIFKRSSTFVGWWATWPAESVNGTMVTDRAARDRYADWTADPDHPEYLKISPAEAAAELGELIAPPEAIDPAEMRRLAPFTDAEMARLVDAPKAILFDGYSVLKFSYQAEKSYTEIARRCLRAHPTDLTAVFLVGIDPVSHCFWHDYEPGEFKGVDPAEVERLKDLIPAYYAHEDELLGELMEAAGPETTVIVCSDHGFRASGWITQPYKAQSGEHDLFGLFVAAGPGIKPGAAPVRPSVFDVAPTVLALLGLPQARDFDGRVLREILEPGVVRRMPKDIPSYDRVWHRQAPATAAGSRSDAAYIEQLRSLGYMGGAKGKGNPAGRARPETPKR